MADALRRIETDELIVYTEHVYSKETLDKCRKIHKQYLDEGKLEGIFDDDFWMGYSDIKRIGIDFSIDSEKYKRHAGKVFGISERSMKNMLKCFAIDCVGTFIFQTIARQKIAVIREFLQSYGNPSFKMPEEDHFTVETFLIFINTPKENIKDILTSIRRTKTKSSGQRKLSPVINYLVIENEIRRIYENSPSEDVFIKWFPIYFWVNITFILPLRATEMLVTPRDCIFEKEGKTYLKVRRTLLKQGHNRINYEVEKDYQVFSYEIPKGKITENIKRYLELTKDRERRFLFNYSDLSVNEMLSLQAFNNLLAEFMDEYIISNPNYDFARYAAGIKAFEYVTAGDSRPIAMANLYFQNAGADICRQLAGHVHIDTSAGYYTNVDETIWASSIIHLQRKLDMNRTFANEQYERNTAGTVSSMNSVCISKVRQMDAEDLSDCIKEGHLSDCMGCRFYIPSRSELDDFMDEQKNKANESAKKVIDAMNRVMKLKGKEISLDELFLSVQTDATRYRMACDIKAKEKLKSWENIRNI